MSKYVSMCDSDSKANRIALGALAIAATLGFGASTAHADFVTNGTSTAAQLFVFGAPQAVDINGGLAGTTLVFGGCPAGTPVMIVYSAECAHNGTVAQWGTIQILLNGVALSPTVGTDDAFCSGNETVGVFDGWATQSMEVVGRCRVGANVVAVTAQAVQAGRLLRLDDMSTVVDR